ncbi:MAG TPA: hypothetical protein EYN67_18240 [Flavobacteriales bacterium]|nr:hypothetical protein [Flavobacteriales bacterium]
MSESYEYQTIVRKHTARVMSKSEFYRADLKGEDAPGFEVTEHGSKYWMSKGEHESNFELSGGEGK